MTTLITTTGAVGELGGRHPGTRRVYFLMGGSESGRALAAALLLHGHQGIRGGGGVRFELLIVIVIVIVYMQ